MIFSRVFTLACGAVFLLSLLGCEGENNMNNNPPSSDWLNEEFVCQPFTQYPKADLKAIALYDEALALSRSQQVPMDQARITRLYEQSAELGFWAGMHNTAIRYYQGNGVPENNQRALYWFRELEKLGVP